jgi:hypothetical protein
MDVGPAVTICANLSDRSCTVLGAVGRKTWRAGRVANSFGLVRAGFEPLRAPVIDGEFSRT